MPEKILVDFSKELAKLKGMKLSQAALEAARGYLEQFGPPIRSGELALIFMMGANWQLSRV